MIEVGPTLYISKVGALVSMGAVRAAFGQLRILSLILACTITLPLFASDEPLEVSLSPARWSDDGRSFPDKLQCPKNALPDTIVIILCEAKVKWTGKVSKTFCHTPDDDVGSDYSWVALRALRSAKFIPATRGGKAVPVHLKVRALFSQHEGQCVAKGVANWGFNADLHGDDYFAPQEIEEYSGWFRRSRDFRKSIARHVDYYVKGMIFSMSASISEDGVASDLRIEENVHATEEQLERALSLYQSSEFIPGHVDGNPTVMRSFEWLYYIRHW